MIKVAVVATVEMSISAVERPVAVEPEVPFAKESVSYTHLTLPTS